MSELIDHAAAYQIEQLTVDTITTYQESAGIAFLESGCDMDIVARLQATRHGLEPGVGCALKMEDEVSTQGASDWQSLSTVLGPTTTVIHVSSFTSALSPSECLAHISARSLKPRQGGLCSSWSVPSHVLSRASVSVASCARSSR